MKLEVGMYVKIPPGIKKIKYITDVKLLGLGEMRYAEFEDGGSCWFEDIKKASYNLIDLIEVGDYVNGLKVMYDGTIIGNKENNFEKIKYLECDKKQFFNYEIKSILTKEQYEANVYKVKESE